MKKQSLTIILCITIGLTNLYSQKKDYPEPEKVTVSDFSVDGDRSVCLWYRSLFSFPYAYSDSRVGAYDYLFSLKNETYMRILLNRNDTSFKFFALHKFYRSVPEIITVTCYYPDNKKITSGNNKGSESVLIINYFDKGCFFDLETLKDSTRNVIVDIKFKYPIFSKKEINFYTDKKLDYKFMYVRMDIPEIYKYYIDFDDKSLAEEIIKPHPGPIIGYGPKTAKYGHLISSKNDWILSYNPQPRTINGHPNPFYVLPIPYYCKLYSYIFQSKETNVSESEGTDDNFPAIVKFRLSKINEIGSILDYF